MPPRREPYDLAPAAKVPDTRPGTYKYPLTIDSSAHYMTLVPSPPQAALGPTADDPAGPAGETFVLPMPKGLQYQDLHDYQNVTMSSMIGAISGGAMDLATKAANKASQLLGGSGIESLTGFIPIVDKGAKIFQKPVLSAIEVLYANTPQRAFQFEYHMTPRNSSEAFAIWTLIQRLRWYSAPEAAEEGYGGIWMWTSPWKWKLTFYYNGDENLYLPKIHQCVLERIDTDYDYFAGGMWSAYEGGSPVGTKLGLQFRELEVSHKAKIDAGY